MQLFFDDIVVLASAFGLQEECWKSRFGVGNHPRQWMRMDESYLQNGPWTFGNGPDKTGQDENSTK